MVKNRAGESTAWGFSERIVSACTDVVHGGLNRAIKRPGGGDDNGVAAGIAPIITAVQGRIRERCRAWLMAMSHDGCNNNDGLTHSARLLQMQ